MLAERPADPGAVSICYRRAVAFRVGVCTHKRGTPREWRFFTFTIRPDHDYYDTAASFALHHCWCLESLVF